MKRQLLKGLTKKPDIDLKLTVKVFYRNFRVFRKTWKANIMFNFLEPLLYLWAMGFGLGVYVTEIKGLSYLHYLAPALIASSAMFSTAYEMTYSSYTRMAKEKIFHGMVATPLSMDDVVLGEILFGTFKGILYGLIFFAVVILFGIVQSPAALLILIPLTLMSVIFSNLSLIWTSMAPNYDSFGYFVTLFVSPMFLFGGVFFPIESLPPGIRVLPWFTPLYHAVEAIRPQVLGQAGWPVARHIIWLAVVTLLTLPFPLVMVKNKLIQ
jgi:lipooligosaccharide transport system permease protein